MATSDFTSDVYERNKAYITSIWWRQVMKQISETLENFPRSIP